MPRPAQPVPGTPVPVQVSFASGGSARDLQYAREVLSFLSHSHRSVCQVTEHSELPPPTPGFRYTQLSGSLRSLEEHMTSVANCQLYPQELTAELDSLVNLLATAQTRNLAHRAISLAVLHLDSQYCIRLSSFALEPNPVKDNLLYPLDSGLNQYQGDVYALGVCFLLISFNNREDVRQAVGTETVKLIVRTLDGDASELRRRLELMLGIEGKRVDFIELEEAITGRKREPSHASIPVPPRPIVPFKPSIKKSPSPVEAPKSTVEVKTNNDLAEAKPGPFPGFDNMPKPGITEEVKEPPVPARPANPPNPLLAGLPQFPPSQKANFVPPKPGQAKPQAPDTGPKPGLVSASVRPFSQMKNFLSGKQSEPKGNDADAKPSQPISPPLSIPKLAVSSSIPQKPGSAEKPGSAPQKYCPNCKAAMAGETCPVCGSVGQSGAAAAANAAFVPKASPKPGLPFSPPPYAGAPATNSKAPVSEEIITKATDKRPCLCRFCGTKFMKKYSAKSDYDQQFADYCSEDCAISFATSQPSS